MKRTALTLALLLSATSPVMAAGLSAFNGHWANRDENTRGIARLHINQAGNLVTVQAWTKPQLEAHGRYKGSKYGKHHNYGKHKGQKRNKWRKPDQYNNEMGKRVGTAYSVNVDTKVENNTQVVVAHFDNSFSKRMLVIEAPYRKRLRIREFVSFTDHSNRPSYTTSYIFNRTTVHHPAIVGNLSETRVIPVKPERREYIPVRPVHPEVVCPVKPIQPEIVHPVRPVYTPRGIKEDKISFNWRKLRVKKVNNRWKIMEGTSHMMMDFGSNLKEASKALGIIQRYRMNEMCYVGRPAPSMTYFLVNGKSPIGAKPGEDAIQFNPNRISVQKVNRRWKIMEGRNHMMMDFESNELEARKALSIIRKYGFTHMCYVGRPNPSMTYFRK